MVFWLEGDVDYDTETLTLKGYANAERGYAIGAYSMAIEYPNEYLTYKGITNSLNDKSTFVFNSIADNLVKFAWSVGPRPITSTCQVFEMTFDINCYEDAEFEFSMVPDFVYWEDASTPLSAEYVGTVLQYDSSLSTAVPPETTEPPVTDTPETTPPVTTEPPATEEPSQGDLNGSGELDSGDATLVLRDVVGTGKLTDEQRKRADMNGNGIVDAGDATIILRIVVGSVKQ